MDTHEIAEQIVQAAAAGAAGVRLRQAEVDAVAADGTLTVRIAGSAAAVSGVRAFSSCDAVVGEAVWVIMDGQSAFAIGRIGAAPYCEVSRSAAQSIPNVTHTDVSFDTEVKDTGAMFDAGAPTRITIVVPGVYAVHAALNFGVSSSGFRQLKARINGAVYVGAQMYANAGAYYTNAAVSAIVPLVAGDYLTLTPYQDSGGALDISAAVMRAAWLRGTP